MKIVIEAEEAYAHGPSVIGVLYNFRGAVECGDAFKEICDHAYYLAMEYIKHHTEAEEKCRESK